MDRFQLWHSCVDAENNNEIADVIRSYFDVLYRNYSNDIAYIKTELQQCVEIATSIIDQYKGYIKQEETKLKSSKGMSIDGAMSKMIINQSKEKIEIFKFLKSYTENKILELSTTPITSLISTIETDKREIIDIDVSQIKTDIISYIDNKWKVDPNKRVYSRKEACEYLQISDRKLTTLLDGKIRPISYAVKPYTFNIEELERYRKEEM
ncbi:MAG: hypothetical protein ACK5KT_14280 [Dysgonomonas sp.]